ncbi:rhomboid family intramembrane serine protease [Amycolatopsis endophytica]|uniref:Membrane associated rhomboid family serine protease n=1 Tax=Amycolatopsis endophytica TaxID=860233 RepID=A0A853B0V8_9PSEU|nr:rhomboid family intramembrane serine protease [Amycolatopsis endophytica]NYI88421.1 membrane associated rhomboid family serine protease [Amycolatopsis endophytica]
MNMPPHPPASQPHQQSALPGCWWHPSRPTGLSCVRCGRPACPDCLREASVGYQCIDCVQTGRREQKVQRYTPRTVAGAQVSHRPVVTPVLIVLNVLVYVITAAQAGSLTGNDSAPAFTDGVLWPLALAGEDQWWRLIVSGFLHYGPIHLAVNMLALWILGRDMETLLGRVRFTALYLVSLLGGAVAVYLFDDVNRGTAGASGAIYGLLGAMLVAVIRLRLNPAYAIGTIVLNLIITVSLPGISLLGHLGGLVVGALVAAAMVYAPAKGRRYWQGGAVAMLVIALLVLVFVRDAQLASVVCGYRGDQLLCTPPSA